MTERNPAYVLQAGSHDAETFRRVVEALISGQGVIASGDMAVTANGTPNMSVNVASGDAFIVGTEQAEQGAYHVYNDATVNKTIATADATNPRYDLVVAKVQDAEYSGATNAWSLAVVTGTPAASPADPAVPANSLTLARVQVDAGVTSIVSGKITDLRTFGRARVDDAYSLGHITQAESSASQTGIGTSATDLTSLTVTYTQTSGRRYKHCVYLPDVRKRTSIGTASVFLTDASNNQKQFAAETIGNVDGATHFHISWIETAASTASVTRKVRASTDVATIDVIYAATAKPIIWVEDLGT